MFAIGAGDLIVGTHNYVSYPPETAKIVKVGDSFNLNIEKIAALNADFFYTFFKISNPQLDALGIPVLYLESPATVEAIPDRMRLWGKIADKKDAAEILARTTEMGFANTKGKLGGIQKGPRVLYDAGAFWAPGPNTFQGDLLRFLKAQNIAHDISGWAPLNAEVIIERDPEVIILTPWGNAEDYTKNPAFASVSAVKTNRIYAINSDYTDIPGPRITKGLEELGKLLYPELFK